MTARATREALGDEILELGKKHQDIFVIDCDVAKDAGVCRAAAGTASECWDQRAKCGGNCGGAGDDR